jgi:hypothetical protein
MQPTLEPEAIEWVNSYASMVRITYSSLFAVEAQRFSQGSLLIDRFQLAVDQLLERGRGNFKAVDEAHNEICVAAELLAYANPRLSSLAYEPPLPNTGKTIDFRADVEQHTVFVDVKNVRPSPEDGWPRYQRFVRNGLLDDTALDITKECGGGELSHNKFTSREKFLEYTLELEGKIAESTISTPRTLFALAFCGTGFEWEDHELQDFVSFYFIGAHRPDDFFAAAESHDMKQKDQSFSRTIGRFASMHRRHGNPNADRLNWYSRRSAAV